MIGRAFLNREMGWFASLLGSNGADDALNGVLLPEGNRGGLLFGVAEHFGNDVNAFNALAAFGITAFSLNAQPVGITTANGTTIRAESFYAREDGSTGALGELIFETDRGATQYLGDNRVVANDNSLEYLAAASRMGAM